MAIDSFPRMPGIRAVALPAQEARTLHVVTAHRADRVPAIRSTLEALDRVLAPVGRDAAN